MKKIKILFLGVISLLIIMVILPDCQQPSGGSSNGGGSSNERGTDNKKNKISAVQIAAGIEHTIALLDDGTIKCWGRNDAGELGYGDTEDRGDEPGEMGDALPTVDLGTGKTAVQIIAGDFNTAILFDDGTVKCWGFNLFGQLGYGDTENRGDEPGEMGNDLPTVDLGTGRTAVQIAAGARHIIALLNDGAVKCWGRNDYGQLGYGDTEDRGDEPGEMGDALPTVDLGTGRTAVQIAAYGSYTVALLDNGTIKCWGLNDFGQLGYGDTENRGDEPGEMGDTLPTVNLGTGRTAVQIVPGYHHNGVLLDNDTIKYWGNNGYGQLGYGYGPGENYGDEPGEMGDTLPTVNLGTGTTAVQIATGVFHTAVLLDNNTLKCWGWNKYGELGYGDTEVRGDELTDMGDNLLAVDLGDGRTAVQIIAGYYHTIALLNDGAVKCWGKNDYGQLGYGDTEDRGDGPGEMGDNLPVIDLGNK